MYARELSMAELREKALSARDKAAEARRIASRVAQGPNTRVLELHAAEFDAKAEIFERDIEALEEQGGSAADPRPTIQARPGHLGNQAATHARAWHAKAEEIRTVAGSMSSEEARRTLDRLARSYEAMAGSAERGAQGSTKGRDAG